MIYFIHNLLVVPVYLVYRDRKVSQHEAAPTMILVKQPSYDEYRDGLTSYVETYTGVFMRGRQMDGNGKYLENWLPAGPERGPVRFNWFQPV